MHQNIFAELSTIITVGASLALLMRLIKQPLIIGHIITGILVGPTFLHLIKSPETFDAFSNIGIALLLFIIGLGLNPRIIREVGRVATIGGLLQVFIVGVIAWAGGTLLGLSQTESIFLGVALTFSSTIIALKLLTDKKEQSRLYGKIAIGMLLVQDVLATIALLFVTSKSNGSFSPSELMEIVIKGTAIVVPLFFVGNVILPRLHRLIAGSQEFLFLFAIGWGFGVAALFEAAGFSLEIGALLGGVALAGLPYTQDIGSRLRPLRDFFIVVFFISLGSGLAFGNTNILIPGVILSTFIVVIIKPLTILAVMGLMGYTKRTSFKTAISLAQVSEFSLVFVVLANKQGSVSSDLVSIITLVALITIAVSTYLVIYADRLFLWFENDLSLFERRKKPMKKDLKLDYDLFLFGYQKGGHEFVKVFQSLKKSFVVIDYNPEVIDTLENKEINYIYGDATDIDMLNETGLDRAKLVVSTMSDKETNLFLVRHLEEVNPHVVLILHADSVPDAEQLYELGASYVIIPHYIGSEKIGSFIRKSGLKRSEFKKYREKHMAYLHTQFKHGEET